MSMTIERFQPEHVEEILGHEVEDAKRFALTSPAAYTVRINGTAIICGGVADMGSGRGLAWAFVSPLALRHPLIVTRTALRLFSTLDYRRIEATCSCGFERGREWLKLLGFKYEGTMTAWGPDGSNHELWARV